MVSLLGTKRRRCFLPFFLLLPDFLGVEQELAGGEGLWLLTKINPGPSSSKAGFRGAARLTPGCLLPSDLFIERFCMTGGNSPICYLKAYHTNLYLSSDAEKVSGAIEEGESGVQLGGGDSGGSPEPSGG